MFVVLLVQDISNSFLSERIWKIFNLSSGAAYVVQDSFPYKSVLREKRGEHKIYTLTLWTDSKGGLTPDQDNLEYFL